MNDAAQPPAASVEHGEAVVRIITIINKKGLHARASARFVKLAGQFDAAATVTKDDMTVSALSIMGLMMLAAGPGTEITLTAHGRQRNEAIEALAALIAARFHED
jgi:phosphocarrier protein HPr